MIKLTFPLYLFSKLFAKSIKRMAAFSLHSSFIVRKVPFISARSGITFVAPSASKCPKLITHGTSFGQDL